MWAMEEGLQGYRSAYIRQKNLLLTRKLGEKPDVKELSKDRWKIFRIRDDDLIDVTGIYVEK